MKIHSKLILAFLFIIISSIIAVGQGDPPLRIEIPTKSDDAAFQIMTCNDYGFVLFYETTQQQEEYKFWTFVSYNIFMQETWRKDIPLLKNVKFTNKNFNQGFLYVLFLDNEKKKKDLANFQVLKIDILNMRYELFSGDVPENARIIDFDIFNDNIVAGLDEGDDQSSIMVLNMTSKEFRTLCTISDSSSRFESLFIDTLKHSITGIFNIYISRSEFYLLVKEFDSSGNVISTVYIRPSENKKLNSGNIIRINENDMLILGTYDFVKGGTIDKKNYFHNESSGFYSIKVNGNQQGESRYFNFLEMENMTGFLKSKEYIQALKKAEKKDESPDRFSLDFDLLLHDIIKKDSLYYFVTEAYYEEYHTVTSTYYDYYGRPVPVSYTVFDGYKYFNAFISCFSATGEKIWDNGMEIYNILTFDLVNRVNIYFADKDIIMAYNREGKIGAKIIQGPRIVEGVEYYPVESEYINDKVLADSKSNMEYWYDNYFVAYGFQNIRNNSLIGNDKRVVFYINKVLFK
jgi:hypothetical protein